jgi:hypothetical protein
MAENIQQVFDAASVNISALEQALASSRTQAEGIVAPMVQLKDVVAGINEYFEDMQGKPFITLDMLEPAKMYLSITEKIAKHLGAQSKAATALLKAMGAVVGLDSQRLGMLQRINKEISKKIKLENEERKGVKEENQEHRKRSGFLKNTAKQVLGVNLSWRGMVGFAKSTAQQVTGLNLSLGGLVGMLVEAYNLGNKIYGLTLKAAGPLGGYQKYITNAASAMGLLRGTFRIGYEEAEKIVSSLTQMGFTMEDAHYQVKNFNKTLTGAKLDKAFSDIGDKFEETSSGWDRNMKSIVSSFRDGAAAGIANLEKLKLINEGYRIQKEIISRTAKVEKDSFDRSELQRKKMQERVSLQNELYAIQIKYNISTQQSGVLIASLMRDFGKTETESRAMYGGMLKLSEEFAVNNKMSAQELLADWQQLNALSRVYQTNLLGISSTYSILVGKSKQGAFNADLGLGKSMEVRRALVKSLTGAPMQVQMGWQARMGKGQTPAEAIMEFRRSFEKEGPMEILRRVTDVLEKEMGDVKARPAESQIRAEQILRAMGVFKTEEEIRQVADAAVQQKLTGKNVEEEMKKMREEMKRQTENEKNWVNDRAKLVTYASKISITTQSLQERIKKFIIDYLVEPVKQIVTVLEEVRDAMPGWLGGKKSVLSDEYRNNLIPAVSIAKHGIGVSGTQVSGAISKFAGEVELPGYGKEIKETGATSRSDIKMVKESVLAREILSRPDLAKQFARLVKQGTDEADRKIIELFRKELNATIIGERPKKGPPGGGTKTP